MSAAKVRIFFEITKVFIEFFSILTFAGQYCKITGKKNSIILQKIVMEHSKTLISSDQLRLGRFLRHLVPAMQDDAPILEQVKEVLGDRIRIIKVDVDKYGVTASQYGIQSVPTLMLFRRGEVLWRTSGVMQKSELLATIDPFLR